MFGNSKRPAFTFIELIVVLAILGILLTAVVPNFKRLWPGYQRKQFVDYMNSLMEITWHNAIVTNKLHRITFDLEKRKLWVEISAVLRQAQDERGYGGTSQGEKFLPMTSPYMKTAYQWSPEEFEFRNFFIGKRDEISLTLRGKAGKIWFFITPEGLAQPVILNIYDLKEKPMGQRGVEFSLVLNPFLVQFKEYETFQKPE